MYPHPPVTNTVRAPGARDANAVATRLVINDQEPKIHNTQFMLPLIYALPGTPRGLDSYSWAYGATSPFEPIPCNDMPFHLMSRIKLCHLDSASVDTIGDTYEDRGLLALGGEGKTKPILAVKWDLYQ
jgi:hypothetical protein